MEFPDADVDAPSIDVGRLGGLFLRLHRRNFSGLAFVASAARTITFAFRDGNPVLAEESTGEASLADQLVERGLVSRDEYARVITRVTEDLVDNEDVAFCQHAIELGYLTAEQVQDELSERVRAKLIQSLALQDCEVELDDAPDALSGVAEYPQRIGPIVYMGVRTFYDEDLLRGFVPDLARHYVRLLKTPIEIARFFELDYEEVALLNAVEPRARADSWFADCDLEPGHALQLLALLHIGQLCEFATSPFVLPETERSGVRAAADGPRPGSRAAIPATRVDTPNPRPGSRVTATAGREEVSDPRPGARAAMPAVREEVYAPRPGSRAAIPAARSGRVESRPLRDPRAEPDADESNAAAGEGQDSPGERGDGARTYSGAQQARAEGSAPQGLPRERNEGSGVYGGAGRDPNEGSGAYRDLNRGPTSSAGAPSSPQPTAAGAVQSPLAAARPPDVTAAAAPAADLAAEALEEARARARVARDGKRGGGYGAQRMRRDTTDSKRVIAPERPAPRAMVAAASGTAAPSMVAAASGTALPAQAVAPTPEYQKAHLKEIMQRHLHGGPAEVAAGAKRDPVRELRSAQESLRDGQYARAEEQLRALLEHTPNNEVVKTYHLWAQLRGAHGLDQVQQGTLRDLAKKLVSDAEQAGFACYVLAHLYLGDRKDDQAEKYFRKAYQFDKTNKDAERHVVILERRKQQAAEGDTVGQRKIFGISINKPKG